MIDVVTFELVPSSFIEENLHQDLDDPVEFSENFAQNGYDSILVIRNSPTVVIQLFVFLLLVLITLAFKKCQILDCKCIKNVREGLFWNSLIRLLFETYFEIMLTSNLNVYKGDWENSKDSYRYSIILALCIVVVYIIASIMLV